VEKRSGVTCDAAQQIGEPSPGINVVVLGGFAQAARD